jgi:hypothetical protein
VSFIAVYDRIVPAANKYMATLYTTAAGRKVTVGRIYRKSQVAAAVVGVLLEQEIRFITARTAGTTITPITEDSQDTLTAGIVCDHGSTGVTEGIGARGLIGRFFASTEEILISELTNSPEGAAAFLLDAQLIYARRYGSKGLVLRQNEGLTIKNLTSSTIGSVSYAIEFDDEPV